MSERKAEFGLASYSEQQPMEVSSNQQRRSDRKHVIRPAQSGLIDWQHLTPYMDGAAPDDALETKSELRKPVARKKRRKRVRDDIRRAQRRQSNYRCSRRCM